MAFKDKLPKWIKILSISYVFLSKLCEKDARLSSYKSKVQTLTWLINRIDLIFSYNLGFINTKYA